MTAGTLRHERKVSALMKLELHGSWECNSGTLEEQCALNHEVFFPPFYFQLFHFV